MSPYNPDAFGLGSDGGADYKDVEYNYNYEGEEPNPMDGTTKINEDSSNTTAFIQQFNSNGMHSRLLSNHQEQQQLNLAGR